MAFGSYMIGQGLDAAHARTLSPERAAKLELDQLRLVDENFRPGILGFPVIAGTIALVLSHWVPTEPLVVWFGAVLAGSVFFWSVHRWFRQSKPTPGDARRWSWILFGCFLIFCLIWTAPPLLFWRYCDDLGHLFMVLVYACNMAGGAALGAPYPRLAAVNIATSAVVMIAPTLAKARPCIWASRRCRSSTRSS